MNVGTCVATPAMPLDGAAVQQWICDAVVVPERPEKVTLTAMVFAVVSIVTCAKPTPALAFAGLSLAPLRVAS
nr:hypothetical protein [Phenylobacterium sp.]